MSMVRMIVGGVDTQADTHVAAVIDANGGILGIESFPADESGYEALLGWLTSHDNIGCVGVDGTGSWGVGLSRFSTTRGSPSSRLTDRIVKPAAGLGSLIRLMWWLQPGPPYLDPQVWFPRHVTARSNGYGF
jgi:hypothetical protein